MFGSLLNYLCNSPDSSFSSRDANSSSYSSGGTSEREISESRKADAKVMVISNNNLKVRVENPIESGLKKATQEVKAHNMKIKDTVSDSHNKYIRIARDLSADFF